EPFDDTVFGFNKEQENKLEVLLKEVSTEYNAFIQKEISKEDNEALKDVEKTTEMDHMDEVFELRFENCMEVEKEPINNCNRMELDPKEEIADEEETLCNAYEKWIQKKTIEVIETLKVGNINKYTNIIIENEMNNLLFNPGGSFTKNERK
ncbi:39797_t:CDS:2, partial [Gigaspora margarita]